MSVVRGATSWAERQTGQVFSIHWYRLLPLKVAPPSPVEGLQHGCWRSHSSILLGPWELLCLCLYGRYLHTIGGLCINLPNPTLSPPNLCSLRALEIPVGACTSLPGVQNCIYHPAATTTAGTSLHAPPVVLETGPPIPRQKMASKHMLLRTQKVILLCYSHHPHHTGPENLPNCSACHCHYWHLSKPSKDPRIDLPGPADTSASICFHEIQWQVCLAPNCHHCNCIYIR